MPDPPTIRALIERWREKASINEKLASYPRMRETHRQLAAARQECADELEALLASAEAQPPQQREEEKTLTRVDTMGKDTDSRTALKDWR